MTRIDLQNILFDQESNHLTAIQDFDFSHVASLVDEYFCFLHSIHSLLTGPLEGEEFKGLGDGEGSKTGGAGRSNARR